MAQLSTEAECVSTSLATAQVIWHRRIFEDIGEKQKEATIMFYDNKSTTDTAKNPIYHSRTCHFAIKHHFIRDAIEDGELDLKFSKSEN